MITKDQITPRPSAITDHICEPGLENLADASALSVSPLSGSIQYKGNLDRINLEPTTSLKQGQGSKKTYCADASLKPCCSLADAAAEIDSYVP